jgi:hypothetical protein
MKLRIGDKVRFLNESGGGIVTRIKDKETVWVEIEEGFEVPYAIKFLVPVSTDLIINKDAENIDLEPEITPDQSVYFIVEPDHELPLLVDEYSFLLFNQSAFNIYFTYSIKDGPLFQTIKNGELGPFQKLMLRKIKKKQLPEFAYHKIEILFFRKSHYISQLPVAEVVYLNEKIIANGTFIRNEEFKNPVLSFVLKENFITDTRQRIELTDYDMERLQNFKDHYKGEKKESKPHKLFFEKTEKEIDLHIEELVDDIKGMTSGEMLNLQIKRFQKELDNAISNNFRKIIFIHGVGNGRLKAEIRNILKAYPELQVMDASYKKYGFGATEVNIR